MKKIVSITNKCIEKTIYQKDCEFQGCTTRCDPYVMQLTGERNVTVSTSSSSGELCKKDEERTMELKIYIENNSAEAIEYMGDEIEKVIDNYPCCDSCCSIRIDTIDNAGREFYAEFSRVSRDIDVDEDITRHYIFELKLCSDGWISKAEEDFTCGFFGEVTGMDENGCSCISNIKRVVYNGKGCGNVRVVIEADELVDPTFWNYTTGQFYGLDGTFTGSIIIDTMNGVTYNGNPISPSKISNGSQIDNVKILPGVTKVGALANSGTGKFCVYFSNNDK